MLIEFGEADTATFWYGYVADKVVEITWRNNDVLTVSVGPLLGLSRPDDRRRLRLGVWDDDAGSLMRDNAGAPIEVEIPEDGVERVFVY